MCHAAWSLLTSELEPGRPADHRPECVRRDALVRPGVLRFVGVLDQQAALDDTVAEIHADVDLCPI